MDRSLPVQAAPDDAANSYEAFLRIDGADPALKAQALRRLGDLRLEQAAMLSAVGDVPDAASQAKAREAVAAYQELLRDFPDYAARDAALYQLARASEVAGDADAAMAALDELVLRHPQGAHADEAQFRRGEVFFSAKRYAEAGRPMQRCWRWARPARSTSRRSTSAAGRSSSSATTRRAAVIFSPCSTPCWCTTASCATFRS